MNAPSAEETHGDRGHEVGRQPVERDSADKSTDDDGDGETACTPTIFPTHGVQRRGADRAE